MGWRNLQELVSQAKLTLKESEADHTLFTLQIQEGIAIILFYVDDTIISVNEKFGIQDTKTFLNLFLI